MKEKIPTLKMSGISKEFPGVKALQDVDFSAFSGEVMVLLGENGAGKSTLMKVLSGFYTQYDGSFTFKGKKLAFRSPKEAIDSGIAIMYQELNLIQELSVGENIFLGREPTTKLGKIVWKQLFSESEALMEQLNLNIDPKQKVKNLSIAEQQMVEIAKSLSLNAELIIMDEPSDALTDTETDSLFELISKLKKQNKTIIYISHRLKEVFRICDRATILRDGKFISQDMVKDLTENKIIELMVGRKLEEQIPYRKVKLGKSLLAVKKLSNDKIIDVNLAINESEIVGIAGLMGAGRTELGLTLFGYYPYADGAIYLNGKEVNIKNPGDAIIAGISYISEDRKQLGLLLGMGIQDNITLPNLKIFEKNLFYLSDSQRGIAVDKFISELNIKTPSKNQLVQNLSGGNQQKVSIAKGLITHPLLLVLDEPTRGVDVGAKKEIYKLINYFKEKGLGIIMISSEMPELIGICDRIVVMHNGTISGELTKTEATQERIMRLAVGIKDKKNETFV